MISKLDIRGFKSIKSIHLDCRRVNLFIGEPNTGKSNILEALGFLSWCAHKGSLCDYVRVEKLRDLFYDGMVKQGGEIFNLTYPRPMSITTRMEKGEYRFMLGKEAVLARGRTPQDLAVPPVNFQDFLKGTTPQDPAVPPVKFLDFLRFYRYRTMAKFPSEETGALHPPDGRNLVALMYSSKTLRQMASDFFSPAGLTFVVKPHEQEIEIQKQSEGVAVSFPYHLSSDTLQRMVFFMAAIESNKNAALVFEEPEAHAFPYYTKHLGERIALDENANQYFIATHNPYLLTAIWEKAPAGDVAVFATYYRDYETRIKPLTAEDMAWLFEADPFLGVSHLVEDLP